MPAPFTPGFPDARFPSSHMIRLSIITPCWNSARTLERTLRSVLDQGYGNLEYILVDGGSQDGTVDIIRKYEGRLARWVSEKDRGVYDAMNKGIGMATGDWVGIINSDDLYAPGVFSRLAALSGEDADIHYGDVRMLYPDRQPLVVRSAAALGRASFWHMPVQHPAAFVRRSVYVEDGGFREGMRIAADYDLMLRLFLKGRRFRHCPEVWAEMDAGGLSDNRWREGKREIRESAERQGVFHPPLSLLYNLDVARVGVSKRLEGMPLLSAAQRAYRNLKASSQRSARAPG